MKRAGIMQPYFFPYLGYFSLIKHTEEFILFDPVQFIRHGWIERNRVLKADGNWLYIKVPLRKHDQQSLIKDIRIDNSQDWRNKLYAQLQPYKKVAPFYNDTLGVLHASMDRDFDDIVTLNKATLEAVCAYLGFPRDLQVFSRMNLAIAPALAPDEWALHICEALGDVDEYWNPPGGKEFFDRKKYKQAGITLRFHHLHLDPYDQKQKTFESGLSIIDAMMFNPPSKINAMLDNYELS